MCGRCEDSKDIISKNDNWSTKRTFALIVVFSVTLSSLGISCFALLSVQNLSHDLDSLKIVLRRSRLELAKQQGYGFNDVQADLSVGPIYETPVDVKSTTIRKIRRLKRSIDSEKIDGLVDYNIPREARSATNLQTSTSIENVELISNIGNAQEIDDDYERDSHPREDIEKFIPEENKTIESNDKRPLSTLPQNPYIPRIIEDIQSQKNHHIKKKAVNFDEEDVESFTQEYQVPHNVYRHRQRGRNSNQLEIIDEFSPQAGRLKSLKAFHLNGDTSRYMLGVHTNYKGNGHLRHAQKMFVDWKVSDWVETISATHSFHLKNGVVTVKESGLYFIYAQIYYLDEHDSNGYIVHRNSENIFQCKVTAPSFERLLKGNTCYTGGVVFLEANDKISIDDISDGRYTLFVPGYSFFGMIKLGDINGK
ncbi:uncharacterized protein LOC123322048 [Coccinella septempunctata]|uniref:uncharacterized protein LOC123322048 n=1 Tax=Coccinella septempunctata TaxID=41139 RepID=UPI001D07CDD4|nr:uncharacterized protein LOC123322048 [Coccinella septempunctata]